MIEPRAHSLNLPTPQDLDILVVEDDPVVRQVIIGNLAETFPGVQFRQAESGNAALALISEDPPDLLLTDLRMPGLNGFALTRILRTQDRTRDLPIIIISGLMDTSSVLKALQLGATDYCVKPIDFELLAQKIRRICVRSLRRGDIRSRNRTLARKQVLCEISALMPVRFPEREGLWIDSPLDVTEGDPVLIDGAHFFSALRLDLDTQLRWSRVEHCQQEGDAWYLKLLFDPLPEDYPQQIGILSRARDRFRRYFGGGAEPLSLEVPTVLRDLSGGGARLLGAAPWRIGARVKLDLRSLVRKLGFHPSATTVTGLVRWRQQQASQFLTGIKFDEIDEDLRIQIMAFCLGAVEPHRMTG